MLLSLLHNCLSTYTFGWRRGCLWFSAHTHCLNRLSLGVRVLQRCGRHLIASIINFFKISLFNLVFFSLRLLSNLLWDCCIFQLVLSVFYIIEFNSLFLIFTWIWLWTILFNLLLIFWLSVTSFKRWKDLKFLILTCKPKLLPLLDRWWWLWSPSTTYEVHMLILVITLFHDSIILLILDLWLLLLLL